MSAVSIRNLDDRVKERLRLRAVRHGRSMEAEVRVILTEAVREAGDQEGLVSALRTASPNWAEWSLRSWSVLPGLARSSSAR